MKATDQLNTLIDQIRYIESSVKREMQHLFAYGEVPLKTTHDNIHIIVRTTLDFSHVVVIISSYNSYLGVENVSKGSGLPG